MTPLLYHPSSLRVTKGRLSYVSYWGRYVASTMLHPSIITPERLYKRQATYKQWFEISSKQEPNS